MISGQNYTRDYSFQYYSDTYHIRSTGSARQYFVDQSMGQYQPQFDVVGPYTLSHEQAYYGSNNSKGNDMRVNEMLIEACQAADEDGVDLQQLSRYGR